ncbi:MAG: hypothetical protein AAF725_24325 [Acidobacteriota bacterium]
MKNLSIDLTDLEITDVNVLAQDGKGMPEFAASCCWICFCGDCSCADEEVLEIAE